MPRCIRAVPPFSFRRSVVPSHGSFDWCGSVPSPDVVGLGSGGVMLLSCIIPSSPVVCCELIKTALSIIGPSLPPPVSTACDLRFVSPSCLCLPAALVVLACLGWRRIPVGATLAVRPSFSPRLAPRSHRVVRRGGMISPFSLLACPMMSSWPWRCRLIRGDLPCVCLLVYSPRLLVSGSGELGRGQSLTVLVSFPGRLRLLLALCAGGAMSVWIM